MLRVITGSLLLVSVAFGQLITTIYDIQSGAVDSAAVVQFDGIVTTGPGESPNSNAFYVQDGSGPYTGIFVYGAEMDSAEVGDSVRVVGTYIEYYDESEISEDPIVTLLNTGNTPQAPEVLTLDQADWEPYEGVLIQIQDVARFGDFSYGEWWVTDGTDSLKVDNSGLYTLEPEIGDEFVSIMGVLSYTYGEFKIAPRTNADFVLEAPAIGALSIDPPAPTEGQTVTVTASITHTIGFSAALYYEAITAGDTSDVVMVTMTNTSGDEYSGDIPSFAEGVQVDYYVIATDTESDSKMSAVESYLVLPGGGVTTPIYDIQYTTDPSGDSPKKDETVTISGVVTAEFWGSYKNRYFYVQDAEGPWNGIIVFNYDGWDSFDFISPTGVVNSLAEGDSVTVTGVINEYYGLTQMKDVTEALVHGPAWNMIAPDTVTPGQIKTDGPDAEAYESCLISVLDVSLSNPDLGSQEWEITDGTDSCRVATLWQDWVYTDRIDKLKSITGVLGYAWNNTKIYTRLARDVVEDGVTRIHRINQVLYSDLLNAENDDRADGSYLGPTDTVTVQGVVTVATGLHYAGSGIKFIFQDVAGGPWSGLLCYSEDTTALGNLPAGLLVQVTGVIVEYGTGDDYAGAHTEIDLTRPVLVLGMAEIPGDTIPASDLRTPVTGEQWESVWVTIEDSYVIENDLSYGQWSIDNDSTGANRIKIGTNSNDASWDDFVRPPVGQKVDYLSGWVYNRHGYHSDSTTYKIEPSYVSDIVFNTTSIDNDVQVARSFKLKGNYPNPFNPSTNINFEIGTAGMVKLSVFDLKGREVRTLVNRNLSPGEYSSIWNGLDNRGQAVSSGVYMYRLTSGEQSATGKMLFLK